MLDTYMDILRNHNSFIFLQIRVCLYGVLCKATPHSAHVTLRRLTPKRVWQRKRPPCPSTVSFSASSPPSHSLPRFLVSFDTHQNGCGYQGNQCEDPLQQGSGLCLLDPYVLPG